MFSNHHFFLVRTPLMAGLLRKREVGLLMQKLIVSTVHVEQAVLRRLMSMSCDRYEMMMPVV
jgi:predicted XRE-type DNA-binding protein